MIWTTMLYISGIFALNLNCRLDTCGDWHQSSLNWARVPFQESEGSFFGDYGIESGHEIPEHSGLYNVADTIRACLDLLYEGNFAIVQGMNNELICNSRYDDEVFDKIYEMKGLEDFPDIDKFIEKEYILKWLRYKEDRGIL